jgi:deoxyribodipyrimidine photo-lyase
MEKENFKRGLFWFRRDLRLDDNVGLYNALKNCDTVASVFIFDKTILEDLPLEDKRIEFIMECIALLKKQLQDLGSDIVVKYAVSEKEIPLLAKKFKVHAVYANEDYDPKSRQRDGIIKEKLKEVNIEFNLFKDTVIFAKDDILTTHKSPYVVFNQYKIAWKKMLETKGLKISPVMNFYNKFAQFKSEDMPTLEKIGFKKTNLSEMKLRAGSEGAQILFERFKQKIIVHYKVLRESPAVAGVSYLSVHNRFGTISIRYLISQIQKMMSVSSENRRENCEAWLDELIFREYNMQLLYYYPHIAYEPFKSEYKFFPWENDVSLFQAWCDGKTGFPIIDAAMKQLNTTGYMHNRLRMIVATFLVKDLLVDYRMGEEYFSLKLLDFDLSANNAGWQWAASTGANSSNSIKFYNPTKQSEQFDTEGRFIKKYLPIFNDVPVNFIHSPWLYTEELKCFGIILGEHYPKRIIIHEDRKELSMGIYQKLNKLTK